MFIWICYFVCGKKIITTANRFFLMEIPEPQDTKFQFLLPSSVERIKMLHKSAYQHREIVVPVPVDFWFKCEKQLR